MNKLKKFTSKRGRQKELVIALGAPQPEVSRWCSGHKKVPPRYCKKIEEFSNGEITVKDLRPDDWMDYWPES